jgi:hypothetical protein
MTPRPQRPQVDIAAAQAVQASDIYDTDNDPQRLLKLSHSLRFQLAQPFQRQPAQQQQQPWPLPGALRNSQQLM